MRIIVTGSSGFLGQYVCEALKSHELLRLDKKQGADILNQKAMEESALAFKPDVILAMAALCGGIPYINAKAYDILATNERLTANTFDVAIKCFQAGFTKKIVAISSSMVFENATTFPFAESDLDTCLAPTTSYGFQKLALERFCKAARKQYGLPYVILRPFNVIGKGDSEGGQHVIPQLIEKIKAGGRVNLIGDGSQVRCFTHASDIARAVKLACESDVINEDFNLANAKPITIKDLAKLLWKRLRDDKPDIVAGPLGEVDVKTRIPDCTKAEKVLGWKAQIGLEEALNETLREHN